jgi:hypothetical protein
MDVDGDGGGIARASELAAGSLECVRMKILHPMLQVQLEASERTKSKKKLKQQKTQHVIEIKNI